MPRLRSQTHVELRRELLGLEVKETLVGFRVDHKPGRFDDHVFSVALGIMGATKQARRFGFAKGRDGKYVTVITHDYTKRWRGEWDDYRDPRY